MIRSFSPIAVLGAAAILAVTGCGSNSGSGGPGAYGSGEGAGAAGTSSSRSAGSGNGGGSSTSSGSGAAGVSVASVSNGGKVLVDSRGMTLYLFEKDSGGKSACYGACASAWPPLTTNGKPQAIGGAKASQLGTTKRSDGTIQVTYAGWPLYTYVADTKPGEANGTGVNSFGALWRPLRPNGEKAGE